MLMQREAQAKRIKQAMERQPALTQFYKPKRVKFVSVGGQSKIFSFHSETMSRDLIVKVYEGSKFSR